jgi:uncharacterized damage-inducible protein DinB
MSESKEIRQLLSILDQAYNRRSWHGTNLRGSIRGLTAQQAEWRPGPERHSIRELVVHAAYWKYVAWRRLTGQRRGSFPRQGSNWFAATASATERTWRADVALLDQMHRVLRRAVERLADRDLVRTTKGGKETNAFLLTGIAAHDLYHAGQIQLVKKLATASNPVTRTSMSKKPEATHPNADAFPPGMPGPALRALAGAGIRSMSALARRTESELAALHGMGPKALALLKSALAADGRQFRRG